MGHFRATIHGNCGEASRLGTKKSGLRVTAASWNGAIGIDLWHDQKEGVDMAEVRLQQHVNGAGVRELLYRGPVSGKPQQ